MIYQKKNAKIIVEAIALDENNGLDLEQWAGGTSTAFSGIYYFDLPDKSRAELGDFIVKDANGKFSIWTQKNFNDNFEPFPS